MMKIPLAKGKFAIVDDCDFNWLNQWNWQLTTGRCDYAYRYLQVDKERYTILMHRMIIGICGIEGVFVDHINRDSLDNRMGNLRLCSRSENTANSKKRKGCTSKYKGVSKRKDCDRWVAGIKNGNKKVYLGLYYKEEDAAKVYDKAAKECFGEFALLNFPEKLISDEILFESKQ